MKPEGGMNESRERLRLWLFAISVLLSLGSPALSSAATIQEVQVFTGDGTPGSKNAAANGTVALETFGGKNGPSPPAAPPAGSQLTFTKAAPAGTPTAIESDTITSVRGLIWYSFGPDLYRTSTLNALGVTTNYLNKAPSLALNGGWPGTTGAGLDAVGSASYGMPADAPPLIAARAVLTKAGSAAGARAAAWANDPVPVALGSYQLALTIGAGTSMQVDPGDLGAIEFFASDSNDSTYLTHHPSSPIFDFGIVLDGTGSSPSLSAFFSYDPSRLAIPSAPTDPAAYQSYANSLLSQLLADTANVSLTNPGTFDETLSVNSAVTVFTGTYTAAASRPGAFDPNFPGNIDFAEGSTAGVAPVPEPATWLLLGTGLLALAFVRRKPCSGVSV
ncbi:MAG TPA: PEP-CTERM sorting domain-containing protein [Nitrospirales bacterium]